jgi:hypothetical protein
MRSQFGKAPLKYRNEKTVIGHVKFDSKKEARYYAELKMLEKAGVVTGLVLQPKFKICEKIVHNGKTLRTRYYNADFQFYENGKLVVVDVKSEITKKNPIYTLKKQLFLSLHNVIDCQPFEFREV